MPDVSYNDITKWRACPIDSLKLYVSTNYHEFKDIRTDSTYSISPILSIETDSNGWQRVVGLKFEGTFIIAEDDLETMSASLNAFIVTGITKMVLTLKAPTAQTGGGQIVIEIDTTNATYHSWITHFKVNKDELSPALELNVTGRFSRDVLTTTTKLFEQNWS